MNIPDRAAQQRNPILGDGVLRQVQNAAVAVVACRVEIGGSPWHS
jgi:hypothetical protein